MKTKIFEVSPPLFRTQFRYVFQASKRPVPISVTVPDMSFSVQELINRFTRGQAIPGNGTLNIVGDLSAISRLDQFEKIDLARRLRHRREVISAQIEAADKQAAELKRSEAFEAELRKRLAEVEKPSRSVGD